MNNYKDYNKYTSEIDFSSIIDFMITKGDLKDYKKGDYFTTINRKTDLMGYVISGAFRHCCYDTKGNEKIVGYSLINGFVGNYPAFFHQINSNTDIQAVSNSLVYLITYDEFNDFFSCDSDRQELRLKIAEVLLLDIYDRLVSIYAMSPYDQYLEILNRCPDLLNMVTLKELASYMMTSPETLSRIRRKIASPSNS